MWKLYNTSVMDDYGINAFSRLKGGGECERESLNYAPLWLETSVDREV